MHHERFSVQDIHHYYQHYHQSLLLPPPSLLASVSTAFNIYYHHSPTHLLSPREKFTYPECTNTPLPGPFWIISNPHHLNSSFFSPQIVQHQPSNIPSHNTRGCFLDTSCIYLFIYLPSNITYSIYINLSQPLPLLLLLSLSHNAFPPLSIHDHEDGRFDFSISLSNFTRYEQASGRAASGRFIIYVVMGID